MIVKYPFPTIISAPGEPWDGSNVIVDQTIETPSGTCQDILFAMENVYSADGYYPIACDFSTLSGTGMVFFQNPNNLHYDHGTVVLNYEAPNFTSGDIGFVYSVETGFIVVLIGIWTIAKNLRKISPLLFG